MDVNKHAVHKEKFVGKQNHIFEVEKVIGHREVGLLQGSKAEAEYLVLWMGYPVEDASWQPWKNLKSCIKLVRDYHNRNSRLVNRRFPNHSQTHRMSLRKTSDNNNDAAKSNGGVTIQENSVYEWEVEDILAHESLDHAKEGKKMHYLVKWIGLPEPIWTEENRVLEYDSKGDLQAYINKEVLFGEMLGEGSNLKSYG